MYTLRGLGQFDGLIADAAWLYDVPEPWVRAVIQTESSWNPTAYRAEPQINDASYGLMQVLYKTARGLGFEGRPEELYFPEINIDLGTRLLGQLRRQYGDDFRRVYSAYNSGRPDLWETSTEVARNVQRALAALDRYLTETVETVTTTVAEQPAASAAGVFLVGLAAVLMTQRKRR